MRILILNQAFWPDLAATSQYATDLALDLAESGHAVSVVSSDRAHDDPQKSYLPHEEFRGIHIERVRTFGLGKQSLLHRALGFLTYFLGVLLQMFRLPAQDVVICLTSPPLVGLLGVLFKLLRGGRLVYWVMDLNPDQAIAAGILAPTSIAARLLDAVLRVIVNHSDGIVALDRFMEGRLRARLNRAKTIDVIPPWTMDGSLDFDEQARDEFRRLHGWQSKFVVMHSGNHSPCHPLQTILDAAHQLASNPEILFVFAGGGVEHRRIAEYAAANDLPNIQCVPYQPLERLSASLSSADLHVVAMGDAFVGIVHPCKVYNILRLGTPILYLGPDESHVVDLAPPDAPWLLRARHGDAAAVVSHVLAAAALGKQRHSEEVSISERFCRQQLVAAMTAVVQGTTAESKLAFVTPEGKTGA